MKIFARLLWLTGGAVLAGLSPAAQSPKVVPSPVHWSTGGTVPVVVHAGTRFQATLLATIDPGWHLYALQQPTGGPVPMVISIAEENGLELMRVAEPRAHLATDAQYGLRTAYFEQAAKFTLFLRTEAVKEGAMRVLHVYARYQACNDKLCLPPQEAVVPLTFRLRP